jgi:cysteine-rich repeat protein
LSISAARFPFVVALATAIVLGTTSAWGLTAEQAAKLLAIPSSYPQHNYFGESVALDGDTVVVGAQGAQYIGWDSGLAYAFARHGHVWDYQPQLAPADPKHDQHFGVSVAVDGDTALVGASEDSDNGYLSGSAYVFTRAGGVWTQQAKLLPADGGIGDYFGASVALDGDTAVVGAYGDAYNGTLSGSAYAFRRVGGIWMEESKLLPADGEAFEYFGVGVALDGDTTIIRAPGDDGNGPESGSAYVFVRAGGVWTQQAELLPADGAGENLFGRSVALDDDTAIIGSPWDVGFGSESGSAYVFTRTGGVWTKQAKLMPLHGADLDNFGTGIGLDGDTAVIGARYSDENGENSGSAYVFTRSGSTWMERAKIVPSDNAAGDEFGTSAALDGDTAFIGAPEDDDNGFNSGSAYVFRIITFCGDGSLDPGEECDDGNNDDGDGCAADCTIEQDVPATTYGGMAVAALLLLVASATFLRRRRSTP